MRGYQVRRDRDTELTAHHVLVVCRVSHRLCVECTDQNATELLNGIFTELHLLFQLCLKCD